MTGIKLTKIQISALKFLAKRALHCASGYELRIEKCGNTGTLNQLHEKGLTKPIGQGHIAFPSNANWQLTPMGFKIATRLAREELTTP